MRRALAALVSLALVLALGGSAAADTGADYSWYRPTSGELAGLGFVVRYLVPAVKHSGKSLTAGEASTLHERGLTVVLVYEWAERSAAGGYAAGVRDAGRAELARREVGAPPVVVYFAVDYDARSAREISTVLAYLAGVAAVIGRYRVGVYGGYRPVHAALDAGYRYAWQTYAWSGRRWDPRAVLRQTSNGALWRGQGDRDVRLGYVGGWAPVMRPVPVPPPSTVPPPRPLTWTVRRGQTLWGIGRSTGVPWPVLARLNHLRHPSRIYPGQRLRLR